MLDEHDRRLIHDSIFSSEHDYFVWSRLLGEPFVVNGILSYFDGIAVAISGPPLGAEATKQDPSSQLQRAVEHWMAIPAVEFVNYFGPAAISPSQSPDFKLIYSEAPIGFNVDLFIPLHCRRSNRAERRLRQDENRVRRSGISIEVLRQEYLTVKQLELISGLIRRPNVEASDAAYLVNACTLVSHPATTVFEARKPGEVLGVGIAHSYFEGKPSFILAAFAPEFIGVSDAMYGEVIKHYREQGAEHLSLGYAVSPGQYRYKRKWGAVTYTPPSWQFIWQRCSSKASFLDCLYWPWQSLTTKMG